MGCGSVADFGHLPAIKSTEGVELLAVYDPDFDRALAAQRKFGCQHAFCDPELFFGCGIDAVTITSPAPTHKANVLACAKHGLPALCEKPLAMGDDDAAEMITAMESAKLPLAVGFCYRFSPVALSILRMVREGRIGDVRALRLIYIWNLHGIHERDPDGRAFYSPARVARMEEGGPLVDCGVHQIDLARWWLGSPVKSWTAAGAWVENYTAPDFSYLHLSHENGALSTIEVSYSYTHTAADPLSAFTYQLVGSEGLIRYQRDRGIFEVRDASGTENLPWAHEKNFEGMYAEWARVLDTGDIGNMPTGADGLLATQIARDATDSLIALRPKVIPVRGA